MSYKPLKDTKLKLELKPAERGVFNRLYREALKHIRHKDLNQAQQTYTKLHAFYRRRKYANEKDLHKRLKILFQKIHTLEKTLKREHIKKELQFFEKRTIKILSYIVPFIFLLILVTIFKSWIVHNAKLVPILVIFLSFIILSVKSFIDSRR